MSRSTLLATLFLVACVEAPDHVALEPGAENVEFATEPPSANAYKLLGRVTSETAAKDLDVAEQAARNDLRNKAAKLGGTLVTIDQDLGAPIPLADKVKVTLVGRVYRALE
jgi:hypothetical protein